MNELRTGYSTGACAAAAAKAAALLLCGQPVPDSVAIDLPKDTVQLPIESARRLSATHARATVIKDAGDDPDVTHGAEIVVDLRVNDGSDLVFNAGPGVGTITKPGLQLPPGEAAINPKPRTYIARAIRQVTDLPLAISISVPGGEALAADTFNPRLGIEGGISIIGTSGIVRPYSVPALRASLKLALDVAVASGLRKLVLVPGNIGRRAAESLLETPKDAIIDVSNEWGYMLKQCRHKPLDAIVALGHPGKLAKLAMGHWNTHSSESPAAAPFVRELAGAVDESETVEGVFQSLRVADRRKVGDALAESIRGAIEAKLAVPIPVAVMLTGMDAQCYGQAGEFPQW